MLHKSSNVGLFIDQMDVTPLIPLPIELIFPDEIPSKDPRFDFCYDCFDSVDFATELNINFLFPTAVNSLPTHGLEVKGVVNDVIRPSRYDRDGGSGIDEVVSFCGMIENSWTHIFLFEPWGPLHGLSGTNDLRVIWYWRVLERL